MGRNVYITRKEFEGFIYLCDAAGIAYEEGLVPSDIDTKIMSFVNKINRAFL